MKKYQVWFDYTETGKVFIEAENAEDAENKVTDALEEEGLEGLKYNCKNRDYSATAEELCEPNK